MREVEKDPQSSYSGTTAGRSDFGINTQIAADGHKESFIHVNVGGVSYQAIFNSGTEQWDLQDVPTSTLRSALPSLNPGRLPRWVESIPVKENREWLVKSVDWSRTDFGSLETWPLPLQIAASLVMADTQAAVVYWGPSLCSCFNKRAFDDMTSKFTDSSQIQGAPFTECWKEVWTDVRPFYDAMKTTIEGFQHIEITLFPRHPNGRYEESFWTGSILPISGENGQVEGFYNRAMDITNEKVRERRANTLYEIAAPPKDKESSIWEHVFRGLRNNEQDFPMAFVYSAEDTSTKCILTLQQSFGLPHEGHPMVPTELDIHDAGGVFQVFYRKIRNSSQPLILRRGDNSLTQEMLAGFDWRGYGEEPEGMVFMPLSVSSRLLGILVFGLNPRRTYSLDDGSFINALGRQISATVAFVLDREEAQQRADRLTLQLMDNEKQIREMAEHGPVGMVRLSSSGSIIWANSQYYKITGHPDDDHYEFSFLDPVHPDERDRVTQLWAVMVDSRQSLDEEIRLRHTWRPPPTAGNPTPILKKNLGVAASVIDISGVKWAEEVQSRLAIKATEARKLQEAFIDIVSHEMRNPLSAITQLADSIESSQESWNLGERSTDAATRILQENAESGRTILICAAHQKRVIDDVLTLSKLDSQLLSITPVVSRPHLVVERALRMFQAEFDTNSILVENIVDDLHVQHAIDWVMLDPSRLTQIFINLLTNAIKFTKNEPTRRITIKQSAFLKHRPSLDDLIWFPSEREKRDLTMRREWGSGEPINLFFSVTDTGRGLKQEEMTKLFSRFQQATKKTHIKYGGSGLGLYISRELTESMGGEIGVLSNPGHGSTFAFWIKARRCNAPEDYTQHTRSSSFSVDSRRPSEALDNMDRISRQLSSTSLAPRPQILLVEDNIINAQVLMKQLERAGCIVYIANHGREALDLLPTTSVWYEATDESLVDIDCILMDVEMPVLDGLSATREIRKLQNQGKLRKHLRIIAITANARTEQINDAFKAGVDAVLPKPFRVMDVLSKMDEIRSLSVRDDEPKSPPTFPSLEATSSKAVLRKP